MAQLELKSDESLLGRGECNMMVGPLSVTGELIYTTSRLHFEPSKLNQMVGVKALTIATDDIQQIEIVGIDRVITVTLPKRTVKFMGKWAKTVHDRIVSRRTDEIDLTQTVDGFGLDERYLVQTSMEYTNTSVVSVGGDLTVTAGRLRFEPSGLDRLMWRKIKIEASLHELEELELTGPKKLKFRVGDQVHHFAGAAATRIYSAIWAAKEHLASGRDQRDLVFESTPANLNRGVLSHPGVLVQTHDGLSFLINGTLDELLGIPRVSRFPWNDIERLDIKEGNNLGIWTQGGLTSLTVPALPEFGRFFLHAYGRRDGSLGQVLGLAKDPEEAEEEAQEASLMKAKLIADWSGRIPDISVEPIALWGPALRVSQKVGCIRGHVSLFNQYVIWVPEAGPESGLSPIVLPVAEIRRSLREGPPGPDLKLRLGNAELHLMPPMKQGFTVPFWEMVGDRVAELALRRRGSQEDMFLDDAGNRRNTYRVGLPLRHHIPARLRLFRGEEQDSVHSIRITNLSLGGAGFASAESFEVGSSLMVSIQLGSARVLTVPGQVIHARQIGKRNLNFGGIEFLDMSVVEAESLREIWTLCQRIEAQLERGVSEKDIPDIQEMLARANPSTSDDAPSDESDSSQH